MNAPCQHSSRIRSIIPRITLILTLIAGMLFVTQARSIPLPVEMQQGGACAGMHCSRGCCTNVLCCTIAEQQQAPRNPAPAVHQTQFQLATIGLRPCPIPLIPPAPRHPPVFATRLPPPALSPRWY